MIVSQVPDEEAHDPAHNQAGQQLQRPNAMEGYARVGRGSRFGAAIEGVEHLHRRWW